MSSIRTRSRSSTRENHNDSIDGYSDIIIADRSSKFTSTESNLDRRRRRHESRATRQDQDSSIGSNNSTYDRRRHRADRDGDRQERQAPQESRSQSTQFEEVPVLESLFLQPRPANAIRLSTEQHRVNLNTEVPSERESHDSRSSRRKKSMFHKTQSPKGKKKLVTIGRLKMLNCFGNSSSSGKSRDDDSDEGIERQRTAMQAYYTSLASSTNQDEKYHSIGQENFGEGNSILADMSIITAGSKDSSMYLSPTSNKSEQNRSFVRKSSSPKEILTDLREEENELNTAYDNPESFLKLSVSDIEHKVERRDTTRQKKDYAPSNTTQPEQEEKHQRQLQTLAQHQNQPKRISPTASYVQGQVTQPSLEQHVPFQNQRQPPRQQHPKQPKRISPTASVEDKATSPSGKQAKPSSRNQQKPLEEQHRNLKRVISPTASIVEGNVTPPRGAVSTSWMIRKDRMPGGDYRGDEPNNNISYHSANTGSASSNSSASVVNLATQQKQRHPRRPQNLGPRCHFCGGDHWIYNCPHMDESLEGERSRISHPHTYRYVMDPEDYEDPDDSITTITGFTGLTSALNTTMETTDSTMSRGQCNQSSLLHCRPCFRR